MASVVGMTEKEAEGELVKQGYVVRVVQVDGESFPMTAEFVLGRMNLVVENGLVVRAYVG
jgi:hypothetical protein